MLTTTMRLRHPLLGVTLAGVLATSLLVTGSGAPALASCAGWSIVPGVSLLGRTKGLNSVSADSASDVWAVGVYTDKVNMTGLQPLVEHWDGSNWTQSLTPYVGGATESWFADVLAMSPADVWAVGVTSDDTTRVVTSLAEHWDGSAWTITPTPSPDPLRN